MHWTVWGKGEDGTIGAGRACGAGTDAMTSVIDIVTCPACQALPSYRRLVEGDRPLDTVVLPFKRPRSSDR